MAKQLNVSLAFTADTGKAKQQLQDLQQSLNKIISSTNSKTSEFGLTKELAQATSEASKLKIMLESATTSSGTLDLGKFSQKLKKSGLELKDYANTLQSLGPEGADAFAKLAQSITTANIPLKQTNKLLNEFATTMKNTVRWQFSSSVLHGFMGAMSGALGYAKDLDKSLNDIRIVTEYNVDQMARFAVEANKAAKALSSTTTDYTNASLIYYQQGLTNEEVLKRTEITVKMANAAGQSAEKVSNQLTAVWNNFYDGSKSLEYYADVMTALGAATASSTDEIAGGLEKFAAIGQTIGLSYEYAASVLATITSNTRQSEEVVGTALKTIFARIQGLNLGETLDDGTSLNKYSEALAKVGIDIFDASGEIKKMDTLLDEIANKWDNISKAQQIALAQTVAGTRQYTQLIALMDNWDSGDSDSMIANLDTAYSAMGALQDQADIYAESWEASSKRVKAAAEGIYDKLLDEKFFIEVNNILEGTLGFVSNLIDGLGGLPGVLSLVASWMLKAFGSDIANSLERITYNIKLTSETGKKEIFETRKQANNQLQNINNDGSISGSTSADIYKQQGQLQDELLKKTIDLESKHKSLTEEEQKQAAYLLDQVNVVGQQIIQVAQLREKEELTTKSLKDQLLLKSQYKKDSSELAGLNKQIKKIEQLKKIYSTFNPIFNKLRDAAEEIKVGGKDNNLTQYRTSIKKLQKSLKDIGIDFELIKTESSDIIDPTTIDAMEEFFNIAQKGGSKEQIIQLLQRIGDGLDDIGSDAERAFTKLKTELTSLDGVDKEGIKKILSDLESSFLQTGKLTEEQIQLFKNFGIQVDESGKIIEGFRGRIYTTADTMIALANIATNVASVFNSIKGLSDIWSNEDLSFGEKMVSTLSTLGMVIGTLISTYDNFNKAKLVGIGNDILALSIQQKKNQVDSQSIGLHFSENALQAIENGQLTTEIILKTILNALDLKKIAIYALIAAAIAAVVVVAKSLYDAYHKDAQGAKEAAEQVEILTKRYEEAKNAAEELKSTISDWDDAVKALEDLDRNTKEYADALDKANEKAKELIETYGLWNDYTTEGGVINFKQGVLEDLQQQANNKANKAENQMYGAEIYANQAQVRSETTNQKRDTASFGTGTYTTYQGGQYENYRQLTDDETQYIAEVASNLQDALGGVTPTAEQLQNELTKLSGDGKLGADALKHLSIIITKNTVGGFISLGDTMSEAAEANLYYAKQLLENTVEKNYGSDINTLATNKDGETDAGRYESILDIYTNKAAKSEADKNNNIAEQYAAVEEAVKDIVNTGDLNKFLKSQDEEDIKAVLGEDYDGKINNDKELGLMYASMLSGNSINTLTYESGNGVGTVKDSKGNIIVDGVSDEVMRREIAKQIAMEKITADAAESVGSNDLDVLKNALTNIINGGSKASEKYGADFSSAILDAISNENFETLDFSSLFSELSPEEMAELSGMDKDGILGMLGISKKDLTAAGYNVDTFVAAFSSALENWIYVLDTSAIEQKAADLKSIAEDAQFGDIIDQEAFDKLVEAGVNTDKYFTQMEDGTYKLTGAAEEFKRVVEGITVQDYINKLQEFNSAQEYARSQIKQNYDSDTMSNLTDSRMAGDANLGAARADYINTFEGTDFGFSDDQLSILSKDSSQYTDEDLQTLANMMDIVANKSIELQAQMLSTADSMNELNNAVEIASAQGIDVTYDAYSQALLGLASSYENCSEEAERYQKALASGNELQVYQAEAALKASIYIGEAAKKYDLNAKSLEAQTKEIMKANNMTEEQAEQATQMAVQNQRLNKGLTKLVNSWKDWKKQLASTESTSQDYADTLVELSDAVQDLIGWYEDLNLSSTFVEDHMGLIEEAATGDINAIMQLGAAVASYQVGLATLDKTLSTSWVDSISGEIITSAFEDYRQSIGEATTAAEAFAIAQSGVQAGFNLISSNMEALANGASLDSIFPEGGLEQWVTDLNAYASATGMTAAEMQDMLSSVGVSANVQTDYQEQKMTVPTYREEVTNVTMKEVTGTRVRFEGDQKIEESYTEEVPQYTRASVPGEPLKTTGFVEVASISMDGAGESPSIDPPKFVGRQAPSTTAIKGGNTSGGGGGGSISKSNKSTIRYKKVDDKLDDNKRASEKLKNKISKTTGEEQKAAMDQLVEEEKKRKKLIEDKLKEAREFKDEDQKALNEAAIKVGIEFEYDDEGNITNYEETMSKLYAELDAAEQAAIDKGDDLTDADKDHIDKLKEKIETLEDAMGTYEDTRELVEDLEDELETLAGMPPLPTATSDLVDVYKEVNDQLDDIEDKLERINNETDRLTGANRVKALKDAAKLEQDKLKTLKDQAEVIAKDIVEKQDNLNTVAKRHGISFEYDENGNITNYDEQMGKLGDEYQAMYDEYAADGEITEAEQANLDAKQANIDEIQGYIDAYSDAVEEGEENAKSQLESFYNWQDKNAEALATTLEFNLEINERDLQRIEYYLGKIEDDFYSAAEAAAMMAGNMSGDGPLGEGGQLGEYLQNLQEYEKSYKALQDAFANGEISEEEYTNQLKTISDGMYENLGNINELDKAMMNYYGDTLAAAGEEIAKYTDQMEHQSSVLEHYASIMEIMGKSNDYEKMGKILEGQASVAADQAKAAKQTMELYQGQAAEKLALYQKALAAGDTAAAELYKKEYDAALAASTEAEEKYLAKTEAYAESLKAILENKLSGLAQDLENALTGGTSFDQMNAALSRAASLQEEYLTTTNQIYETNKLMRTAQQEIDKSSNSVAKNRLKQFIGETQELQNQNKLSKYELDIQQAKYNLLLAEIAVEEAQNAKSTVRLQRDSEGNFGYVYTADDQKTAEAEQKLADAQNRLYNIGLDGANQYTEKYQQTLSEMYSTLTDLQQQYLSGAFESEEEYNNAVAAAKEYYYQKLEQYSSLHAVALTTDSRVIEDAWSSQFSSMVYSTSQWKDKVDGYVDGAAQAFADWKVEMEGIEEELGLDDIEGAVDDIKEASNELLNELTKKDGVLDKVKEELTAVSDVTTAWANQRLTIQDLIGDYEDLTTSIDNTIKKMLEVPDNPPPEDPTEPETPSDPTPPQEPAPPQDPVPPEDPTPPAPPATPETPTVKVGGLVNAGNAQIYDYAGDSSGEHQYFSNDPKYKVLKESGDWIQVRYHKLASGITGWFKKADVTALNTGGYTGDWSGSYGKLAFLHQKELVLNQGDTENFLAGMDLLNKIVSAIDLYSMNSQLGGMLSTPSLGHMNNENMLEQQVHIEASFPNATDHSEIEEAFNNLINKASQYANRK